MALYLQGSVLPCGTRQDVNAVQLNPIAKAVFGVARVTFDVRTRYWHLRDNVDARPLSS